MEVIVPVAVAILVFVLIVISRKENLHHANVQLSQAIAEKEKWSSEKVLNFGDVQRIRQSLQEDIDTKFEDQERRVLMHDIVNEWADLKIKTFEDRRSWLRSPPLTEED